MYNSEEVTGDFAVIEGGKSLNSVARGETRAIKIRASTISIEGNRGSQSRRHCDTVADNRRRPRVFITSIVLIRYITVTGSEFDLRLDRRVR